MSLHLEHLNPEQLAAVTLGDQHALILAGAGSGKTRVLTTRIAWLIKSGRVGPGGVLGVTFTNKAAREMFTRLSAMLPVNPRGMWIGTFHGLANRLLRAHHREAGLPQTFQILDSQDQLALVKRLTRSMNVDEDRFPPRETQYFINARKDEGLRAAGVRPDDEISRRLVDLYAAYDEQCQKEGVADFAELLLRSYELLSRNELLREHYARRFRYILVDEFQDTNRLQYRWLKTLAGVSPASARPAAVEDSGAAQAPAQFAALGPPWFFAVGDDDQSIYAFRGANVGNMDDYRRDFRVQTVVRLEQNYRSHGHILDAANALIAHNKNRLGKNLWTSSGPGEPLRVYEAETDADEARWLVDEVQALCGGEKRGGKTQGTETRLSQIAILYRSNAQSRIIEHALFSRGIPYRVYGGLRFFERAEIKHALAYLRLLAAADDDNAFLRVVNFPPRGIGARSVEQLQDAARAGGTSLWNAVESMDGRARASLAAFRGLIERLRDETAGLPLTEVVEHAVAKSGLVEHYKAEREGADRIENLGELVNAAAAFEQDEQANGLRTGEGDEQAAQAIDPLTAFLTHAALEAGEHQAGDGQDALQMMTVHSAKGLEFEVVFITGLEEGLFPHEQSALEANGLEEERRLAYVAITRARNRLYLSFAQTRMLHGQTRYSLPSRFFDEIPDTLMKWLTPRLRDQRDQRRQAGFGGAGGFGQPYARQGRADAGFAGARGTATGFKSGFGAAGFGAGSGVGFRIGQNVTHPKFGPGVIVDAEGQGNDARVQVNFGRQGLKWLAVSVAKLQTA